MSLKLMFDLIQKKSFEKNKKYSNFNGRAFWQPIKKILKDSDNVKANKWKKINSKDRKKVMALPEYYINGHGDKNMIAINHFIIQTIRIPLIEKPTLRKIIQVALNIGQYTGRGGKKKNG